MPQQFMQHLIAFMTLILIVEQFIQVDDAGHFAAVSDY
jgi:hypothetical protein